MDRRAADKLGLTVLYVEDEESIRDSLSRILGRRVFEIHIAENGQIGLDMYHKYKPDVVITDIRMPIMTGLVMSRAIKKDNPHIPIIVTTAFTDTEHFIEAIEIGVDRFVLKPVDTQIIVDILEETAERIRIDKELEDQKRLLNEYKKAVDASAAVSISNTQGHITYVNDQFCELSGYARDELLGKPYNLIRHPNVKDEVFEQMWQTISAGTIWKGVLENCAKGGSSFFVDIKIIPVVGKDAEIVEYIGIYTDITELVMKERELESLRLQQMKQSIEKASDIKLKDLIENIPLPSVIVGGDDKVLSYNRLFEKQFDMFEDKEVLNSLGRGELILHTLFVEKEGYVFFDELMDWKEMVADLAQEELNRVVLKVSNEEHNYTLRVQRAEKMGDEVRYIVCMDRI